MTDLPPQEKSKSIISRVPPKAVAITSVLAVLISIATLVINRWDKSNADSAEMGRLQARLEFQQNQLLSCQKGSSNFQSELATTQQALQAAKVELNKVKSDALRITERRLDLERSIQALQVQNTELRESVRRADSCRPIQNRITEIENKMERTGGAFGGYSSHQLEDARQQLADHQASLRACLSRTR